ncbi:MAG TPA: NepR family anti-sigma factor [Hyphomonadaceae bacterium]|nr:NepR family anti-sigma factor [Hyphomonadaceae bacterium]
MGKDHSGGDSGEGRKDRAGEDAGAKPVDARVARRRQDPIGRRLRQMYDDVVSEDVPDDFMSFLEQADERKSDSQTEAPQKRALKAES